MPDKRRIVTSEVCFGSEKAGLMNRHYIFLQNNTFDTFAALEPRSVDFLSYYQWFEFLENVESSQF